jgi:hypothetical protein
MNLKKTLNLDEGGKKEPQIVRIYFMKGRKIVKDSRVGMLTYKGSPKAHLFLKKYRVSFRNFLRTPLKATTIKLSSICYINLQVK